MLWFGIFVLFDVDLRLFILIDADLSHFVVFGLYCAHLAYLEAFEHV